jgi:hypothetical protein
MLAILSTRAFDGSLKPEILTPGSRFASALRRCSRSAVGIVLCGSSPVDSTRLLNKATLLGYRGLGDAARLLGAGEQDFGDFGLHSHTHSPCIICIHTRIGTRRGRRHCT